MVNPLDLPEILARVGSYITIWHLDEHGACYFQPKDMLSCIQVSHHFRNTLLPILWYTFDEGAMLRVPIDVIRKCTLYFRVHLNYRCRRDYRPNNREPCTRLTHLTTSWRVGHMGRSDIDFIKSNPGLKHLEARESLYFKAFCGDLFSNLQELEYLRYYLRDAKNHHGPHHQLFQPISANLKVLHLRCDKGTLDLQGLFFPNVKKLLVRLSSPQDMMDLLHGCPNLERLGSNPFARDGSTNFIPALKAGACPLLSDLAIGVTMEQEEDLAHVLEHRTGFQKLEILLDELRECLTRAINHHASSLTHLSVHVKNLQPLPVFQILSSCGQLKSVEIGEVEYSDMEILLSTDRWKNPELLESIRFKRWFREQDRCDPILARVLHGWMIPSGYMFKRETLETLFEVAKGFERLGVIMINSSVFKRIAV
ncbi:MAG: hypothetical protein J3Q66DRAFT_330520 [Benniella sp.]|nr:MAG: hypothetical protein J3Q66DRAFT_330520 [Benniella sp.]